MDLDKKEKAERQRVERKRKETQTIITYNYDLLYNSNLFCLSATPE